MKKEAHLDTVQSINSVSNQLASLKLDVDLCPSLPSSPDEALVTQLGVCFEICWFGLEKKPTRYYRASRPLSPRFRHRHSLNAILDLRPSDKLRAFSLPSLGPCISCHRESRHYFRNVVPKLATSYLRTSR
jgi:hypothetical protein